MANGIDINPECDRKVDVNVVWLKRDLRISDNEVLMDALKSGKTLLYYVFETFLIDDPHYDERHWRFVWQSIQDINGQLKVFNTRVYVYFGDAVNGLNEINTFFNILSLFSHEEIGLLCTYERDKQVDKWCRSKEVHWQEYQSGAVVRGKKNRIDWDKNWRKVMKAPLCHPELSSSALVNNSDLDKLSHHTLPESWLMPNQFMLKGGEGWAFKTLQSFLDKRGKTYQSNISKPLASRRSCSRLSPYLAWGNISLRQFYQIILLKGLKLVGNVR